MKKTVLIIAVILSISLFAGCGSQKAPVENPTGTEAAGDVQTDNTTADTSASEKQTADASAGDMQEKSSTEVQSGEDREEEKTMTGMLDEIKDFMFVIKVDEDTYYAFNFEKKPDGLDQLKVGDNITVTYTGEVTEIDAFTGKIISVEKAE